ncbi:MAG: aquaporin [Bacilli bacterium]|nr:aquaporin [Bacilli bacterium]
MKENWKKYLAECVGTAVLTLVACGVAVIGQQYALGVGGWWVATSFAFGLVIVAMAYSIGNISGCHINPAVSLAMLIRKQISLKDFCFYVLAQTVGAFIGSLFLALCLRGNFGALGGNEVQDFLKVEVDGVLVADVWSLLAAFFVEVLLTFVFVIAILGVTDKRYHDGKHAGIVIGLVLALVHLMGLGFTGTSVNPARSLAPAVLQAITGNTTSLTQVWIWILAPLAGAALAAVVYGLLTKGKEEAKAE